MHSSVLFFSPHHCDSMNIIKTAYRDKCRVMSCIHNLASGFTQRKKGFE